METANISLTCATDRAARHTGVPTTLIEKIRRQSKDRDKKSTMSPLHTPGKHQPRPADRNVTTDMSVTRQTVQEFYVIQNEVPSCYKLLSVILHKKN
jgi:hypothetical protein